MVRSKGQRVHEVRSAFAAWAFAATTSGCEIVSPAPDGAGSLILLEGAERAYRTMLLRDRDVEVTVFVESAFDERDRLALEASEAAARFWLQEDERSALATVHFQEASHSVFVSRRGERVAVANAEELARQRLADARIDEFESLATQERPGYLHARKRELARVDAMRSRPPTPRTPAPPPPALTHRQRTTADHHAPEASSVSTPTKASAATTPLKPQPPCSPSAAAPLTSTAFILDCERHERAALRDAAEAFHAAVETINAQLYGAAPVFVLYAVERDEDVERRAIASAYFDMLLSACRIVEELLRREVDVKQRRRELAAMVPAENQAWLRARQQHSQRAALDHVHELQMEQLRRDAIRDREIRELHERTAVSKVETAARVDVLHHEASERAIAWAHAQTEWSGLREVEMRRQLDLEHRMNTLVWTEQAHGVCIVDEKRLRSEIFHHEAERRRELRSGEMSLYLRARKAEALNIDVAKSLHVNYDDKAAALQQQQAQLQSKMSSHNKSASVRGAANRNES
jgi:hypothetical protein